jgi:hypothetical protein
MFRHNTSFCPLTLLAPLALTFSLGATTASAIHMVTDDAQAFFSQLNPTAPRHLIDFEAQSVVGNRNGGGVNQLALPDLTLSAQMPALKILNSAYTGNHNTTPNGRNYLSLDTDVRNGTGMSMTFNQPLYALGFNLIDHDTSDITLTIGDFSYELPEVNDGEAVFFGWILDDPLLQIDQVVLNSGRDGQIALDDLFFAGWPPLAVPVPPITTVPEPQPGSLLLAALLMLGACRVTKV